MFVGPPPHKTLTQADAINRYAKNPPKIWTGPQGESLTPYKHSRLLTLDLPCSVTHTYLLQGCTLVLLDENNPDNIYVVDAAEHYDDQWHSLGLQDEYPNWKDTITPDQLSTVLGTDLWYILS